tara:strand:- start:487 stop:1404 length:918 start_codon:yes stop_codon:yes gene_type:complete
MANQYGESYCGGTPTFYTIMGDLTSGPPQFSCSSLPVAQCESGTMFYQNQVLIHQGCYVITPGPSVNVTPGIGSRGGRRNIRRQSTRRGKVPGNGGDNPMIPFCAVPSNQNLPECEGWGTPSWDKKRRGGRLKPKPRRRKAVGGSMGTPSSCPPGTHMMPDGSCMQGAYHGAPNGGGYRKGGRTKPKRKFEHGGPHAGVNEFRNRRTNQVVTAGTAYHVHPDKGPMEGAVHNPNIPGGTAGHDFYDRINGNRMGSGYKRGGRTKPIKKYPHGGMHMSSNSACKMITSRIECVSPCNWEFDYGTCH